MTIRLVNVAKLGINLESPLVTGVDCNVGFNHE